MKKNILLFATLLLLSTLSFAQTLYRTYYDFEKQHVQEEYYANSYGVKNGAYKKYSEYGGILIQGTYSNDKKEGRWIVKYDNGRVKSDETYKDDVLDGPAVYHDYFGPNYDIQSTTSGSYKNGAKEGTWTIIEPIGPEDYSFPDSEIPQQAWSGCNRIKYTEEYSNDEKLKLNGKFRKLFYPSGKIYSEGTYRNDNPMEVYIYYPNGNIFSYRVNGAILNIDSTLIFGRNWKYPGGTKDSIAVYNTNLVAYQKNISEQNRKDEMAHQTNDSLQSMENAQEQRKEVLSQRLDSLYKAYVNLYVVIKQATLLGVPLVDQQTRQPVMKATYPHGQYLFKKSDTLIKNMWTDCKNTQDISSQIAKLNSVTALINKLISMANTDTKDIDKEMKKADTMDDIKKILGF